MKGSVDSNLQTTCARHEKILPVILHFLTNHFCTSQMVSSVRRRKETNDGMMMSQINCIFSKSNNDVRIRDFPEMYKQSFSFNIVPPGNWIFAVNCLRA